MERCVSMAESDMLSNIFKVGSNLSLPRIDSEMQVRGSDVTVSKTYPKYHHALGKSSITPVASSAQFQDFLKKIPSTTNLLTQPLDAPELCQPDCSQGMTRVPSLDLLRSERTSARSKSVKGL